MKLWKKKCKKCKYFTGGTLMIAPRLCWHDNNSMGKEDTFKRFIMPPEMLNISNNCEWFKKK